MQVVKMLFDKNLKQQRTNKRYMGGASIFLQYLILENELPHCANNLRPFNLKLNFQSIQLWKLKIAEVPIFRKMRP